ncbi:gp27 [Streptococcus pneumoniae]|nr:gp27 [Streptococcus pneumoniae]VRJ54894.1 gp27 [Streptococcus pneumoniae]VSP08574.1 gp27 [Streptococcus pneumoniae]VSP99576.1 gp27 [Streptococcus pneumoniae]VSU09582.1 gp27 [Streptococcus pneumoniae]
MFILRHGTREDKPFLRSVVIGVTGLDISCRDYGVFVVTKDVYEKVKVGDEVML